MRKTVLILLTLITLVNLLKVLKCSPPYGEKLVYGKTLRGSIVCVDKPDREYYKLSSELKCEPLSCKQLYTQIFYFNIGSSEEVSALLISMYIKITDRLALYIYDFKKREWYEIYVLEPHVRQEFFTTVPIFFWCNITVKQPLPVENYVSSKGEVRLMALNPKEEFIEVYYDYLEVKAIKLIKVTFKAEGLGEDVSENILSVDNVSYSYSDLPLTLKWREESSHTFSWKTVVYSSRQRKRYILSSVRGLSTKSSENIIVAKSGEVVAQYSTQYYVNISSSIVKIVGGGWCSEGELVTIEAPKVVYEKNNKVRYVFQYWKGDLYSENSTLLITVTKPLKLTPVYIKQYYIEVHSTAVQLKKTGWYNESQELVLSAPILENHVFEGWYINGTLYTKNPTLRIVVKAPLTIEVKYSKKTIHIENTAVLAFTIGLAVGLTIGTILGVSLRKKRGETIIYNHEKTKVYD